MSRPLFGRLARSRAAFIVLLAAIAALAVIGAAPASAAPPSGRVWAWGSNEFGQLGNGSTTNSHVPVEARLPNGATAIAIAAGSAHGEHSLAMTAAGEVWAWGLNTDGQLGDGTHTSSDVPVQVVQLPPATAIAAGDRHSLAVTASGEVWTWGSNGHGELGNGTNTSSDVPVHVTVPPAVAVAGGDAFSLALTSTGKVYAWGLDAAGQLGDGVTNTDSNVPKQVKLPPDTTVTAIAAGGEFSLALTSTGQVLAWGDNRHGELGDATTVQNSAVPVHVKFPAGTIITAIATGHRHSLAVTSTGQVFTWGSNLYGQLGDGNHTESNVPERVQLPAFTTVTAAAGGYGFSLALTSTGKVLGWGENNDGQLGDGSTFGSSVPVRVDLPTGTAAVAIAGGMFHSLAILSSVPASTTTLSASPTTQQHGKPVTLTATVHCPAGTARGTVTFLTDHTDLGTAPVSNGQATLIVRALAIGQHRIIAEYGGDLHCAGSISNPVIVTITAAPNTSSPGTGTSAASTSAFVPGPGLTGGSRSGGVPLWALLGGVAGAMLILTAPLALRRRRGRHS